MKSRISVLFYPKKSNMNIKGEVPVQLRITINGKRLEMSTDRMVNPDLWIQGSNSVKGTKEEGRVLNTYLNNLETNVYKAINTLELSGKDVTLNALRSILKGDDQKSHTLINLFKYHNTRMKSLVGIDFAIGTYKRYVVTLGKVEAFLKEHFRKDDICIDDLDHAFITNFEFYLKTVDKVQNNTAMKYIKNLKKVVKIAIENEWLDRDPFTRFKCTYKDPNRGFLSAEKLEELENKTFAIERLNLVRDMFVFSCYTGLAYADMEKLTPTDIKMGIDGERWITTYRQKTDTRSSIPLLPKAVEIIHKYENHPEANNKGALLPVISNQKLNSYLKEIAILCQIEANLTFHTARHTFATTITLSNGVPIETVSRMLGHTSIKTTQIYSKVVDTKVSTEMSALKLQLLKAKETKLHIATA